MKVEIWSDVVCPFCYIAKRHYEKALADFPHADELEVEFKSYQLDPDFVQPKEEPTDMRVSLAAKYGKTLEEIDVMYEHIVKSASAVGLEYHMDKVVRFNTLDAHKIGQVAKEKGIDYPYYDALFKAYFTESKNLGDMGTLKAIALSVGLTEEDIQKAMEGDEYAYKVKQDIAEGGNLGVQSVPFFVFNRRYGVVGAEPIPLFLETIEMAYEDWKKSQPSPLTQIVGDANNSCDIDGNC